MRAVSDTFKAAVAQAHTNAVLVEVLVNGVAVEPAITSVTAGTVTLDQNAQARGRMDLTMIDDGTMDLVPLVSSDRLAPYGNELRVSRGIAYPNGTSERVALGVFRIDDVDVSDAPVIHITGQDRSARITDARFENPTEVTQGTNVATQILSLAQVAFPDVAYDFVSTPHTTGHMIAQEGEDRWQLCQDFATNAGLRLYFNGDGVLVLVPESTGAPVADLVEGTNGVLLAAGRRWSRTGSYNVFIVTGENTGEILPVRATASDTDPLSPTYASGPFGRVPKFMQSQFIVTTAQAQDAANAMLARGLGTTQSLSLGTLVLPYLEPGDVVRVTRERTGISAESHVLDAVTIPLGADQSMTATTRATTVI